MLLEGVNRRGMESEEIGKIILWVVFFILAIMAVYWLVKRVI